MNITIIGSSGAGKTVFISVLAERFSDRFLPKNPRTKRYTAEIYGDLVDEQRWPDSTGAGQIKDLAWELVLPGCGSAEITVLDTPGQDIQDIYSGDEPTPSQEKLKGRIDGSDILVLFVNLVDIINGKTYRERESLKSFIRFAAMDVLSRNSITRVAILFSQHDQLKSLLAQQGMDTNNVREVVNKYIPELNHEIGKVPSTRVYLGFVASVADVETRWDPQREVSVVVPAKNFRTLGLTGFIDKLDVFVHSTQKEKQKRREIKAEEERLKREEESRVARIQEKKSRIIAELASLDFLPTHMISRLKNWCDGNEDSVPEKIVRLLTDEIYEDKKKLDSMECLVVDGIFILFGVALVFTGISVGDMPGFIFCLVGGGMGVFFFSCAIWSLYLRFKEGGVWKKTQQIELKERLLEIINE